MQVLTFTEENYLKTIYAIQYGLDKGEVSVNEIAEKMKNRPATVTDMLRKLSDKELISYQKYKKVTLSTTGLNAALQIVRKHRLWETFLHDTLCFSWDEVHEVAEQLEHIHSPKLIAKLDAFLGYPKVDPHGDPIPNAKGELPLTSTLSLVDVLENKPYRIVAVKDTSVAFLHQLERMELKIGSLITVIERMPFDKSHIVSTEKEERLMLSEIIASNILVKKV